MILAGGKFDMRVTFVFSSLDDQGTINTKNSKKVVDQMVERYWWLCPMRELIFDHSSAFGVHRVHENGDWDGDFKQHLE